MIGFIVSCDHEDLIALEPFIERVKTPKGEQSMPVFYTDTLSGLLSTLQSIMSDQDVRSLDIYPSDLNPGYWCLDF